MAEPDLVAGVVLVVPTVDVGMGGMVKAEVVEPMVMMELWKK
jgi:hypothetical protein